MKVLIELPDDWVKTLDQIALRKKVARVDLIRLGVQKTIETESDAAYKAAFGAWKDEKIDGVEFQRKLREEWE
jgi:hypothetical protein